MDSDRLLIVLPRGLNLMELPLDLRQPSENHRQLSSAPIPPNDEQRLGRIASGIGKPVVL